MNFFVNGQDDAGARITLRFRRVKPAPLRIGHYQNFLRLGQNLTVELVLDPAQSFLVQIDIPQHVRCKVPLRIKALVFLLEVNPLQIQRLDRLSFFRRQFSCDPHK